MGVGYAIPLRETMNSGPDRHAVVHEYGPDCDLPPKRSGGGFPPWQPHPQAAHPDRDFIMLVVFPSVGRFIRFPPLDFILILASHDTTVVVDLGQNFPFWARMFHFGNGSGNLGRMSSDLGPSSPHSARRTTWSSPRWRRSPYLHPCTVLRDIPVSREQNLENALSSVNPRRKAT